MLPGSRTHLKDWTWNRGRWATSNKHPPPEALFDLDGKRSVKTIHERHIAKATMGSPPPQQKGKKNEAAVEVDSSEDEDSASLSSNTGPCNQTAKGADETSPTSSAEDSQDESAANGR